MKWLTRWDSSDKVELCVGGCMYEGEQYGLAM